MKIMSLSGILALSWLYVWRIAYLGVAFAIGLGAHAHGYNEVASFFVGIFWPIFLCYRAAQRWIVPFLFA